MQLVCAIYISSSVRQILIRDTYVRSSDHQVVRCGIREVDITAVYIYDDASLHLTEIVDDLSDMGIGVQIVIVVKSAVAVACEVSVDRTVNICSDISVKSADVTMTEAVSEIAMSVTEIMSDIVSEVSVTMAEIMSAVAEVMTDRTVVADVHVVSVTEVVTVSAHVMAVQIACCMRRCSDQQENKLEDQKNGEDDRDAREDLLRQIQCFKPIYKKFHCCSPFLDFT